MLKNSLPILVGTAVIIGCVGLGANAAYGTGNPGQEHAQNHTTVLWEYTGYPDITKPQPYVDSVRGADIHAFDEYVKQPAFCGKTFQIDVYKTVVKGQRVETLWSKGYLEYAHDGGFLAYGLGYTPYKVLTGKDTECQNTPTAEPSPTTPPATPEPTPTGTPTSPPITETPTPEPTETPTGEPTTPPVTESPAPTGEPTEPATPTPTTPTEPEPTSTPSAPESPSPTQTPVPSTEPTQTPTPSQSPEAPSTGTSTPTPTVPTKTDSGTTPKTHSTDGTARTLAYTGTDVKYPAITAGILVLLGVGAYVFALIRKRRFKNDN